MTTKNSISPPDEYLSELKAIRKNAHDKKNKINILKHSTQKVEANIVIKSNDEKKQNDHCLEYFLVSKSNALARSYSTFTLSEKRVMECLLAQIDSRKDEAKIKGLLLCASDYAKLFKIKPNHAYMELESATDALFTKSILFREKNNTKSVKINLMAKADYLPAEGKIIASFTDEAAPHIKGLTSHFSTYALADCADFKSKYTWKLFELINSWSGKKITSGKRKLKIDQFKFAMGVTDCTTWYNFKVRSLEPAIKEIEKKASIPVSYSVSKAGRKVDAIIIEWEKK